MRARTTGVHAMACWRCPPVVLVVVALAAPTLALAAGGGSSSARGISGGQSAPVSAGYLGAHSMLYLNTPFSAKAARTRGISAVASRGDRKDSDSGFCVIDRKSMRTLDSFIFRRCGAIHEVRWLDEVDLCHCPEILRLPLALSPLMAGIQTESHEHRIT